MPMSVDHAEDTLYNALKLDPANPLTYRRLAGLYARNGTYKSAVVSLRAALELRPVDAEAYHELGVLYVRPSASCGRCTRSRRGSSRSRAACPATS